MKKILLIGGNGYIGSRLYDFFCNISDYNIEILDCNDYTQENNQQKKSINARYQDFDKNFYSKFNIIILLGAQGSISNSRNLNKICARLTVGVVDHGPQAFFAASMACLT
jgi:nucleoside-diphosphate-sugar epimerase